MRRDFAAAANWFEAADRLAPSALALTGAIRAHRQIDGTEHIVRAATLALRLQARYPNDPRARALAERTVAELAPQIGHVQIDCDQCEIEIDGVLQNSNEFYVAPGSHRVRMRWTEDAIREDDFEIAAGAETSRRGERPLPPAPAPPPPPPPPPFRFHLAVPIVGGFATVALAVGAAISWSDAVTRADALIASAQNGVAMPDAERAEAAAEDRTTALLVSAIVAGTFSVGAGIFTRWRAPIVVPTHTADATLFTVVGQF